MTRTFGPEFGDWVRSEREARGWSLEELADQSGLEKNTIWRIETGRQDVRGGEIRALAVALEVTADAELRALLKALGLNPLVLDECAEPSESQP